MTIMSRSILKQALSQARICPKLCHSLSRKTALLRAPLRSLVQSKEKTLFFAFFPSVFFLHPITLACDVRGRHCLYPITLRREWLGMTFPIDLFCCPSTRRPFSVGQEILCREWSPAGKLSHGDALRPYSFTAFHIQFSLKVFVDRKREVDWNMFDSFCQAWIDVWMEGSEGKMK